MDLAQALKTTYFQALSPEIGISVYDAFAIPENVTYPYVIISDVTFREDVNQSCKLFRAEVTLDIVTGFSSPKGMNTAWQIGEAIENIVNPTPRANLDMLTYGWQIGQTRLASSDNNQFRSDNYWIYRNIRTYSHIIWMANES